MPLLLVKSAMLWPSSRVMSTVLLLWWSSSSPFAAIRRTNAAAAVTNDRHCPSFECYNDSSCTMGSPDPHSFTDSFRDANGNLFFPELSRGGVYCGDCPISSWTGLQCNIRIDRCGRYDNNHDNDNDGLNEEEEEEDNGGICFHYGRCIERRNTGRDSSFADGRKSQHFCDCTHASSNQNDADDVVLYAGRRCEYRSTMICDDHTTVNGRLFCANGGICPSEQGTSYLGCTCPEGYYGPSCEFVDVISIAESTTTTTTTTGIYRPEVEDCLLPCQNGGRCRKGVKDLSFFDQFGTRGVDGGVGELDHFRVAYSRDLEFCVCPPGFVGLMCETMVEICGDDDDHPQHACFHGSKCQRKETMGGAGGGGGGGANGNMYTCDCKAGSTMYSKLAGEYCQFKSTVHCSTSSKNNDDDDSSGGAITTKDESSNFIVPRMSETSNAFCVNGGVCLKAVGDSEEHAGCACPKGLTGDHCEKIEKQQPEDAFLVPPDYCRDRETICYNGGRCLQTDAPHVRPGYGTYICDCSQAFAVVKEEQTDVGDGNDDNDDDHGMLIPLVGHDCTTPPTDSCKATSIAKNGQQQQQQQAEHPSNGDEYDWHCYHGGTCLEGKFACECPKHTIGSSCEIILLGDDSDGGNNDGSSDDNDGGNNDGSSDDNDDSDSDSDDVSEDEFIVENGVIIDNDTGHGEGQEESYHHGDEEFLGEQFGDFTLDEIPSYDNEGDGDVASAFQENDTTSGGTATAYHQERSQLLSSLFLLALGVAMVLTSTTMTTV